MMTHSKSQKINYFVFLQIFLLVQAAVCDGNLRDVRDTPDATLTDKSVAGTVKKDSAHPPPPEEKSVPQNAVLPKATPAAIAGNKTADDVTSKSSVDANKTIPVTGPQKEHIAEGHGSSINPGALLRGVYVFVGLTILVMAYIVFRSFRLTKTRAQMVRKYGVLAHRQDVEMRPLPLEEEDDEDTTVFDASNVVTNNAQHQHL